MTIVINKKLSKKDTKALIETLKKKPKHLMQKYFGKAKIEGDPLEIQKQMEMNNDLLL